jgi:hypothetical protein
MRKRFPALPYDAGLIGPGSEVLGFDDERSRDHGWRPRAFIFLSIADMASVGATVESALHEELPRTFRGFPTLIEEASDVRARAVHSLAGFTKDYLGVDATRSVPMMRWLLIAEHKLVTMIRGEVFHSGRGELEAVRQRLRYYPTDVWLYLLASQWQRLGQQEHLMGRAGDTGDELGSRVLAARLVRDVMRLTFLLEREYAPYDKWFGRAFATLRSASELTPTLAAALGARSWKECESFLSRAYERLVSMQNELGITHAMPARVSRFFTRPYLVIQAGEIAAATRERVSDPRLRWAPLLGAVWQFADCTDILERVSFCERLRGVYQTE